MEEESGQRKPVRLRPLLLLLVSGLLAFYVAINLLVAAKQRWFIYVPPVYAARTVDRLAAAVRLERWTNAAGECIGMKRLAPVRPARGSVLIFYGNGSCAVNSAHYADDIQGAAGLDVYIMEYPGYADRAGTPSQRSIFRAADDALRSLGTNAPLFLVGESLGSGVAAYLAGTSPEKISGLALLSPYDRLTDVAQEHMPWLPVSLLLVDRFPSADYLRNYHGPVGVMVDGNDRVVPEKFGRRLYDGYAGPKRLWQFSAAQHITIAEPPEKFWGAMLALWQAGHP